MPEELGDDGEALAEGQRTGGIGVAEVVDAHVLEAGAGAHARPGLEDAGEPRAGPGAGDDPGVGRHAWDGGQHVGGFRREGDRARAGLAVGQVKLAGAYVHVLPAQGEDLVAPAAREHEEADSGGCVRGDAAGGLQLVERGA